MTRSVVTLFSLLLSVLWFSPVRAYSDESIFLTRQLLGHAQGALDQIRELPNPLLPSSELQALEDARGRAQPSLVLVDWMNEATTQANRSDVIRCTPETNQVFIQHERWMSLDNDFKKRAAALYGLECLARSESLAKDPSTSWTSAYLRALGANFTLGQILTAPMNLQTAQNRQLRSMRSEMEVTSATRSSPQSSRVFQVFASRGRNFIWRDFPLTFKIAAYDRYDFYRYDANRKAQWLVSLSRFHDEPDPNMAHTFRSTVQTKDFVANPDGISVQDEVSRDIMSVDIGRRVVASPVDENWTRLEDSSDTEILYEEPNAEGYRRSLSRILRPFASGGIFFDIFQIVLGAAPESADVLETDRLPGAFRGQWRQKIRAFTEIHGQVILAKQALSECLETVRPNQNCGNLRNDLSAKHLHRDQQFQNLFSLAEVDEPRLRRPAPPPPSSGSQWQEDGRGGGVIRRDRTCWIIGNRISCNY